MKRFFIPLLVLCFLVVSQPLVFGAAAEKSVDKLIESTKAKLQNKKKEATKTSKILSNNRKELGQIQNSLNRVTDQLKLARNKEENTHEQLNRIEGELISLENRLSQRRDLLQKRVLVLYKHGPLSYLEVVFAASSFADLVNRYELASYFIRQDLKLLDDYRLTLQQVKAKRKEIASQHQILVLNRNAISSLQSKQAQEKRFAASKVDSTQAVLNKIQQNVEELEAELAEYERLSRELGSEIRRNGSSASLGTGKMMWPVQGRLSSSFGWRVHPVLRTRKFHNGQDIAVSKGTSVVAADSGVVFTSGYNGGYGYLVVIDHGHGLSTFYGHNSLLLVRKGDMVVKGQKIALSGNTGLSTGSHVHFEVRINGEPVDPLHYLP